MNPQKSLQDFPFLSGFFLISPGLTFLPPGSAEGAAGSELGPLYPRHPLGAHSQECEI